MTLIILNFLTLCCIGYFKTYIVVLNTSTKYSNLVMIDQLLHKLEPLTSKNDKKTDIKTNMIFWDANEMYKEHHRNELFPTEKKKII